LADTLAAVNTGMVAGRPAESAEPGLLLVLVLCIVFQWDQKCFIRNSAN
jgi:hypothetical protein